QAKAQYKWHKHVPLMRFVGPRKELWAKKAAELNGSIATTQATAAAAGSVEAINFWELPARYRPLPISEAEIEAIESGGASLL
ncbi:hypothetical protein GGI12_005085, partial [Dipsacomyces acuminosporus]